MKEKKKAPWVVAILNFLLPGLGYLYLGKRTAFGVGLVIWLCIMTGLSLSQGTSLLNNTRDILEGLILGILFAYDGYKTAQE